LPQTAATLLQMINLSAAAWLKIAAVLLHCRCIIASDCRRQNAGLPQTEYECRSKVPNLPLPVPQTAAAKCLHMFGCRRLPLQAPKTLVSTSRKSLRLIQN
jgi:hypothetical protein